MPTLSCYRCYPVHAEMSPLQTRYAPISVVVWGADQCLCANDSLIVHQIHSRDSQRAFAVLSISCQRIVGGNFVSLFHHSTCTLDKKLAVHRDSISFIKAYQD